MNTLKLLPSQRVSKPAAEEVELSYWKAQAIALAHRNDDLRYIVANQQKELHNIRNIA
tara:strand:+ start:761 stop:934 length:174 start_codon:yes stop_codon:yes gene_type:complete